MTTWQDECDRLAQSADIEPAVRYLVAVWPGLPAGSRDRFDIGMRLKAFGRLSEAVDVLGSLTTDETAPNRYHATLEVANCLALGGRTEDAALRFADARALDPGSHWPVIGLVDLMVARDDVNGAFALIADCYDGLRPDGRAMLAKRQAEIAAYMHTVHTRALSLHTPRLPGSVPALGRAGLLMMVKDEEDILLQNLEHHYALGFRCFCILDNNSTDATAARIATFRERCSDALVLTITDPIVGYYQSAKMAIFQDTLERYAALAGIKLDWMFFIDADEFIAFCGADDTDGCIVLEEILTDPHAKLLVMNWVNAASPEMLQRISAQADPFAVFSRRMTVLPQAASKIAFRIGLGLTPMMGNHFVDAYKYELSSVRMLTRDDWYMMHFPLRSLDHVRSKIINGGRAFRASQGLDIHGGHWRMRYDEYEKSGEVVISSILRQHTDALS